MQENTEIDRRLRILKESIYTPLGFQLTNLLHEPESKEYEACRFQIGESRIICRTAKTTPKKEGQFVTFWKREKSGPIQPFSEKDHFDLFVINTLAERHCGQFIFPKSELIKRGMISSESKDGKRGFRIYPPWSKPANLQAIKSQRWQLNWFLSLDHAIDFKKAIALYAEAS
ncbi:MAG: MepB family protein [Cyclobacteriaceae bacterium]